MKRQLGYVLRYAANDEKTELSRHPDLLSSALNYVTQDGKTDLGRLVSGINCTPDTAQEVMTATKQQFGKTDGTMAFHGYQSFAPGEVTPEQAHNIGVQLAYELWGERFQVLVATHLDKESHIHNHFVINSVSFVDGKRFHSDAKFLHRMLQNRPHYQMPVAPKSATAHRHFRMKGSFTKKQEPYLRRLYFYYCYKLGVFKKHPQSPQKMHFLLREELRYLDRYNRELRFLHENHILTDVQLQALQAQKEQELEPLISRRRKLKYQLKKSSPEDAARIQEEIDSLSPRVAALRADIRMCKSIMDRSRGMVEKLERIRTEEANRQMDERQQGYLRYR